jgi:hypothetical protein
LKNKSSANLILNISLQNMSQKGWFQNRLNKEKQALFFWPVSPSEG